jgi:hypothetical protein
MRIPPSTRRRVALDTRVYRARSRARTAYERASRNAGAIDSPRAIALSHAALTLDPRGGSLIASAYRVTRATSPLVRTRTRWKTFNQSTSTKTDSPERPVLQSVVCNPSRVRADWPDSPISTECAVHSAPPAKIEKLQKTSKNFTNASTCGFTLNALVGLGLPSRRGWRLLQLVTATPTRRTGDRKRETGSSAGT